jgi:hypothetical protein
MQTKILILASGPSVQWMGNKSRHLLPIADEPLVMRTARLCSEFGHPATIVTDVPAVQAVAQRYFHPGPNRWIYDTIRNTQELWARRTIILAGDVLFYDQAINVLLRYKQSCVWVGPYGVLGLTFAPDLKRQHILKCLSLAWDEADQRGHGELQILLQLGLMTNERRIGVANMFDFDIMDTYRVCLEKCPWCVSQNSGEYLEKKEDAGFMYPDGAAV